MPMGIHCGAPWGEPQAVLALLQPVVIVMPGSHGSQVIEDQGQAVLA